MVVDRSQRTCLLCQAQFTGRTFICRACSDTWRDVDVPAAVRQQFYEALDRTYGDRSNTGGEWNLPLALLAELEQIPIPARAHMRVLELGSGGGFLGARLWALGFQTLTLSEFTTTALDAARSRVPGATFVAADASNLPFADASFDLVISADVLEHIPQLDAHLAEVARVLPLGGRYFLKTPNRPLASAYYRLRDMHDAYFWHPSMVSVGELRERCRACGLQVRMLAQPHLTGAQLEKLPGPRALRPAAARLPLQHLPANLRPHLEAVATRVR